MILGHHWFLFLWLSRSVVKRLASQMPFGSRPADPASRLPKLSHAGGSIPTVARPLSWPVWTTGNWQLATWQLARRIRQRMPWRSREAIVCPLSVMPFNSLLSAIAGLLRFFGLVKVSDRRCYTQSASNRGCKLSAKRLAIHNNDKLGGSS
jgi:hypothetical protein